ncbi:hypothetical protein [Ancylobacter defluvii]|uniref:Uncharacterized protein n=1 Tax=Ancylobacter defluvii TaxID=1282440 RepID=A0A9W6K224_9HYPH|nr:hypothetical protein [Ancylobacter defluvii]MBS7586247.1 hypothetical protein [Ancylobacter defluvii]GLK85523.1 hypothetical protein GCM10017653_35930 [Ancylobacter defluvii]
MADSETSMSLSRPSRRDILSAALLTVGGSSFNTSAAAARQNGGTTDAAVLAWKAWRAAHRRTLALCRKQQRLESELARTIGFPQAVLAAAELPSPVRVSSLRQFDELAADVPWLVTRRAEVAEALRAHQERWDDADRAIGYSVTRQEEAAASADEERLIVKLFAVDATSLRGLSAKLDVLIAVGADGAEGRHFPWPELRRIRRDVGRLATIRRQGP